MTAHEHRWDIRREDGAWHVATHVGEKNVGLQTMMANSPAPGSPNGGALGRAWRRGHREVVELLALIEGISDDGAVRQVKVRDVLRLVEEDGWYFVGQRGSHRQYRHPTKPGKVTVAGKPSDEMAVGTLGSIFRQAGIRREEGTR